MHHERSVNLYMNEYKISLGIDFNGDKELKNIKKQLTNLTDNTHRIRVDIDNSRLLKQIEHAKKELRELNNTKGNKPSLDINTKSLEASMDRVANAIDEVRKSLGTIDDASGMKSLVTSVNQIATALGKAENESDSLIKSLSALSKKDFSVNIGINAGKKATSNETAYGNYVRQELYPELKRQEQAITNYIAKYYKTNPFNALDKLYKSSGRAGGLQDIIVMLQELERPIEKKDSLTQRISGYQDFFRDIKEMANMQGIDLSPVLSQFDKQADQIVKTAYDIKDGTNQAEESFEKLKQIIGSGSGINADNLNIQLDSIVTNLNEIKTALKGLSSSNPLSGLTSSFDRLSGSIEKLLTNAEKVKGVLNSGLSNTSVNTGAKNTVVKAEDIVPDSSEVVQSAQQVGTKIGDSIEQGVKQSIDLDDSLDELTLALMDKYSVVGDKGSDAFKEIRQAIVECRNALNTLDNTNFDEYGDNKDLLYFHAKREAIDNVTKAIANQMQITKEAAVSQQTLSGLIADYHNNGYKVHVPDSVRQEYGDDYNRMAKELSSRVFTSGKGEDFESFVTQLNEQLGETISLSNGAEVAFKQLYDEVIRDRQKRDESNKSDRYLTSTASTEEILEQNGISREEISEDARFIVDVINSAEQQIAQASTQAANVVEQNEEKKQQSYRETADAVQSISKNTSLVRDEVDFNKMFNSGNQSAKKAQQYFKDLLAEEKAVISVQESFDDSKALQSFTVSVQRATGEVEKLHYAISKTDDDGRFLYQGSSVSDKNIEKQTEARIKSANKLQTQLEEIKIGYKDMGAPKPIKDSDHQTALDKQYRRVEKAIDDVRNADNSMSASVISNAEKQRSILESMVKTYRNQETLATSLRSKNIETVGATYDADLDKLVSDMRKDGVYTSGFEKGAKNLKSMLSDAVANKDKDAIVSFLNGLDKLEAGYKRAKAAKNEFNASEKVGNNVSKLKSDIEILQQASPSIKNFKAEINGAEVSIESLLKDLDKVSTQGDFKVVEGRLESFTAAAEASGIDLNEAKNELTSGLNRLKSIAKEINGLKIDLFKFDDTGNIEKATNRIEELKAEAAELRTTLQQKFGITSFDEIDDIARKGEEALNSLIAKAQEAKLKLAESIKADIDLGNYANKMDAMEASFNQLYGASETLQKSYKDTETAYKEMIKASETSTGDEVADRERLIQAQERYIDSLQRTNNLIKQQARVDSAEEAKDRLAQSHKSLESDMVNWLKNNSKAAKEYGETIENLIDSLNRLAKADNLKQFDVNSASRTFKNITKDAETRGLTGLKAWDKLVSKVKEYSVYVSAAEMFMYAEQALRDMFEQVKLIDSAMTELKKVTDETDASYNNFLKNAGSRAKELGTTIDGLVSSTADFARLGYGFKDAQGLAEVANIYAVVGDDIEGVEGATESLISTMAAFKGEMNGMSDADFAMRIVDSYNELGNRYAISSGGLGEALERSASSLAAANNTLHESASLIVAANEVVQSPEKVGNALKTVSMRMKNPPSSINLVNQ